MKKLARIGTVGGVIFGVVLLVLLMLSFMNMTENGRYQAIESGGTLMIVDTRSGAWIKVIHSETDQARGYNFDYFWETWGRNERDPHKKGDFTTVK